MSNWFKRLFGLEGEEVEQSTSENTHQQPNDYRRKKENLYNNKPKDAKVVYEYPKGNFRFPVIPDEIDYINSKQTTEKQHAPFRKNEIDRERTQHYDAEKHPVSFRASAGQHQVMSRKEFRKQQNQSQSQKQVQTQNQNQKKNIESSSSKPRRFRPTEVPSPVFGFTKPPKTMHSKAMEEVAASTETVILVNDENEISFVPINEANFQFDSFAMASEEINKADQQSCEVDTDEMVGSQYQAELEMVDQQSSEVDTDEVKCNQYQTELKMPDQQSYEVDKNEVESSKYQAELEMTGPQSSEDDRNEEESKQQPAECIDENLDAVMERRAIKEDSAIKDTILENQSIEHQLTVQQPIEQQPIENKPIEQQFTEEQHLSEQPLTQNQDQAFVPEKDIINNNQHAIPKTSDINKTKMTQKTINWDGQVVPYNVLMLKQDIKKHQQKWENNGIIKPPLSLLEIPPAEVEDDKEWLQEQSRLLDTAFASFNVGAKVVKATKGPSVTQFEVQPEIGVRVNKITNLSDDLKLALAARDIRIEAPIPGKSTVGIEVPNRKSRPVVIREILRSPVFQKSNSPLAVALGLDISGQPIVTDIKKMPHGLIAGATGSGKSVCINSIIISLIYKAAPHEVKLLLIDPKMVELAPYNGIPHLVSPVITDVKAATAALKWAVEEMERRYELFAHEGVRDITRFNEKVQKENSKAEIMPYLVIIIDELADLMMVSPADVEEAICRIAQKARACGIHLLLATQRPSVDVITGLIKANVPTRIAFSVSSQIDSRTIIDNGGAEKLLGRGDMLFSENGSNKPIRIQGNFVNDEEIERVTQFVKQQMKPNYLFVQEELIKQTTEIGADDELFAEACQFVIEQDGASASSLQRRFRIGYIRAARLVDLMESQGIISEHKGSKPREILVTKEQLVNMQNSNN